jgi:hypothetical protein
MLSYVEGSVVGIIFDKQAKVLKPMATCYGSEMRPVGVRTSLRILK